MTFLADAAGHLLSLEDEKACLLLIGGLAASWSELQEQANLADYGDVFDLLFDARPLAPALSETLQRAGWDPEQLESLRTSFRGRYEDHIPDNVRRLLAPIGRFKATNTENAGALAWKLLSVRGARSDEVSSAPLRFSTGIAANAQIELEAGDRVDEAEDFLLRLSLIGDIKGNGGVSSTLDSPGLSTSLTAEASRTLSYWYQIPRESESRPYVSGVASRLADLPSPFDLRSIIRSIREDQLDRVQLKGGQSLSGSIDLQFDIGHFSKLGAGLIETNKIEFSASVRRGRELSVLVYGLDADDDVPGEALAVELDYGKSSELKGRSAWEFGVDLSEIAMAISAYIKQLNVEYRGLLEDDGFGAYLAPGTWLENQDQSLLEGMVGSLDAQLTDTRSGLRQRIRKELDGVSGVLDETSEKLADRLLRRMGRSLSPDRHESLKGQLGAHLQELQSQLEKSIAAKIGQLGEDGQAGLVSRIQGVAEDLDLRIIKQARTADQALASIRAFLDKLGAIIRKLGVVLEKAAQAKLTIRLSHEEQLRRNGEAALRLLFSEVSAQSNRLYESFLTGDFELARELLANPPHGVEVSGSVQEILAHTVERGIEVGVLGIQLSEQTIFKTLARFSTDSDGNIMVTADLSGSAGIRSPWEAQSVGYLSHTRLRNARRSGHGSVGLTARHQDSDLRSGELALFLEGLFAAGLISSQCVAQCQDALHQRRVIRTKIDATITARLDLDAEGLTYLMSGSRGESEQDHAELVLEALERAGAYTIDMISAAANEARRLTRSRVPARDMPAGIFLEFQPLRDNSARTLRRWRQFAKMEYARTQRAKKYRVPSSANRALRNSVAIHHMIKGYWLLLREVGDLIELEASAENLDRIKQAHERMSFYLTSWMRVSRAFISHPADELHKNTVAFFVLLALDAGVFEPDEDRGCMSISLEFAGEDDVLLFA